jgi:hypothetical protein
MTLCRSTPFAAQQKSRVDAAFSEMRTIALAPLGRGGEQKCCSKPGLFA